MTAISHTICHSVRDEVGGPNLLFRIKGRNCQLQFCISCQCVLDAVDMHAPSTPPLFIISEEGQQPGMVEKCVYFHYCSCCEFNEFGSEIYSGHPVANYCGFFFCFGFFPQEGCLDCSEVHGFFRLTPFKVFQNKWLCQSVKFQVLIFCNEELLYNLSFTDFLSSQCQLIVGVRWKFDKNIEGLLGDLMSVLLHL